MSRMKNHYHDEIEAGLVPIGADCQQEPETGEDDYLQMQDDMSNASNKGEVINHYGLNNDPEYIKWLEEKTNE